MICRNSDDQVPVLYLDGIDTYRYKTNDDHERLEANFAEKKWNADTSCTLVQSHSNSQILHHCVAWIVHFLWNVICISWCAVATEINNDLFSCVLMGSSHEYGCKKIWPQARFASSMTALVFCLNQHHMIWCKLFRNTVPIVNRMCSHGSRASFTKGVMTCHSII